MSDQDKSAENPPPAGFLSPQRQILRDEKGRILKGSGGLEGSGRPRSLRERIGAITSDGSTIESRFNDIWEGDLKGFGPRERLEAGKWLADRYYGKAVDVVASLKVEDTNEDLAQLVSDALIQLAGSFRKPLPPKSEILDLDPSASLVPQNPKPPEDDQ